MMNGWPMLRGVFAALLLTALLLPGHTVATAANCDSPETVPGIRTIVEAYSALAQLYVEPVSGSDMLLAAAEAARGELERANPTALLPDPPKSLGSSSSAPLAFATYYCYLWEAAGDAADPNDIAYASIRTMTSTLNEAHTQFFTPSMYQSELESSSGNDNYEGIGATLRSDPLTIQSVFPGSPAEDAGLRSGDQILAIDGQSAEGLTAELAVRRVRGEAGTTVRMDVRRPGQEATISVTITRAAIRIPTVIAKVVDGMGYLGITSFPGTRIDEEIAEDLASFEAQGVKALIVDLRGNPGGRLDTGSRIASLLIPNGAPIYRETTRERHATTRAVATGPIWNKPIVALIDAGTASMGELLASALKEQAGATLIGQNSAGAVAGSIFVPLSDGSAMQVTTLRIDSGLGALLNVVGLAPDITVRPGGTTVVERGTGDAGLDAALTFLRTRLGTQPGAAIDPPDDYELPAAA